MHRRRSRELPPLRAAADDDRFSVSPGRPAGCGAVHPPSAIRPSPRTAGKRGSIKRDRGQPPRAGPVVDRRNSLPATRIRSRPLRPIGVSRGSIPGASGFPRRWSKPANRLNNWGGHERPRFATETFSAALPIRHTRNSPAVDWPRFRPTPSHPKSTLLNHDSTMNDPHDRDHRRSRHPIGNPLHPAIILRDSPHASYRCLCWRSVRCGG